MPLGGRRDYMWGGVIPVIAMYITEDPGPTLQFILLFQKCVVHDPEFPLIYIAFLRYLREMSLGVRCFMLPEAEVHYYYNVNSTSNIIHQKLDSMLPSKDLTPR